REVEASSTGVAAIKKVLERHRCQYIVSKTWTTDAIYRETAEKVQLRKAEGCLSVEMECAAFFAVAQFRKVTFAQILYGGDDVSCADWDSRSWQDRGTIREKIFWLAAEACLEL
ncbi:MAG TPA: purine-nucleoside phosphorylase, partial [Bacillota bacterium]|nr:purine-nucleoside phosphorylase [Bacillota bacterium]